MNAPLPNHLLKALETVSLEDKYALESGAAFMSGVQALVRLPMLQKQRDARQGKNTAGLISGYRGSPLGGYDQSLWRAKNHLAKENIVFQPGVNEELAATAIWGTQQLGFAPESVHNHDGVFGIWYGKGPGVDRCSDVFKHANMAGTTPWGGVIAVAGDDHIAKSSTAAHQSDQIFIACGSPVFFPSGVQDILDLGIHAFAMSRFCGLWSGMKTIQEIVESSATVIIDPAKVHTLIPQFDMPLGGLHIRWPDDALSQEARLFNYKWAAALAYIRANKLNHNVIEGAQDRYGIVASGKAYNDTREALQNLGLDDLTCQRVGIRLHKVNVSWPLEPETVSDFALGLQEILVVEEKRAVIEPQIKDQLYSWSDAKRPTVLGKFELTDSEPGIENKLGSHPPRSQILLRAAADLNPSLIARAIASRLKHLGVDQDIQHRMDQHIHMLDAKEQSMQKLVLTTERQPWFCSGCPHNTSTVVPEGSRAMAGIGCHFMSLWMDRSTTGFTQMGGEGTPWIGQQPFIKEQHIFANIGDGTYFHSGILAIRQSVAAGVNITYKILFNDAVAMTGGQPIGERAEGHSVIQIAQSMRAEGAQKITIVTDEPDKYALAVGLPADIQIKHRDELDAVQRAFREIKGTTVIVYDQTCATEKRRRRKRGTLEDPAVRVMINEEVCEGCGDCGEKSNCISIEPLETELGRKRTINQSACNKDVSCVKGFCPSFVTVEGGTYRATNRVNNPHNNSVNIESKSESKTLETKSKEADLNTDPVMPNLDDYSSGYGIVVAGVGGTGVITIGQVLGFAAHLEGLGIVTQDSAGLAQKGGSTWSHVLIARDQHLIRTTRVSTASADLIVACDPIVGASKETLLKVTKDRTRIVLNAHSSPTAEFVKNPAWANPLQNCQDDLLEAIGGQGAKLKLLQAHELALDELGDSLYVNFILLGFAWQNGFIPLRKESLLRAIELNAVSVEKNKKAFDLGRRAALMQSSSLPALDSNAGALTDPAARNAGSAKPITFIKRDTYAQVLSKRALELCEYQNAAYAKEYERFVESVKNKTNEKLALVVAKNLYKLMAYKDEYEVARLHSKPAFNERIKSMFEGDYKVYYHLAPPIFAKKNANGELIKQKMGPLTAVAFKVLAPMKVLRATPFDIFGRTQERKAERRLIKQYKAYVSEIRESWHPEKELLAIEIANVPESIKGYGHVKEKKMLSAQRQWEHLMHLWRVEPAASSV